MYLDYNYEVVPKSLGNMAINRIAEYVDFVSGSCSCKQHSLRYRSAGIGVCSPKGTTLKVTVVNVFNAVCDSISFICCVKYSLLQLDFHLWKEQKSQGAKSGEYAG